MRFYVYNLRWYLSCFSAGRCLQFRQDITMWHWELGVSSHVSNWFVTNHTVMVRSVKICYRPAGMLSRSLEPVSSKLASIRERVFCLCFSHLQ